MRNYTYVQYNANAMTFVALLIGKCYVHVQFINGKHKRAMKTQGGLENLCQ